MKTKQCKNCKKVKSRTEFYTYQSTNQYNKTYTCYMQPCKECKKIRQKELWAKKKDNPKVKEKNRLKTKKHNLKKFYNMTLEDYNTLVEQQNGLCAICGKVETMSNQFGPRPLSVDHRHSDDLVRELLCSQCNHLIGNAKEDIEILKSAIRYLKKWGN